MFSVYVIWIVCSCNYFTLNRSPSNATTYWHTEPRSFETATDQQRGTPSSNGGSVLGFHGSHLCLWCGGSSSSYSMLDQRIDPKSFVGRACNSVRHYTPPPGKWSLNELRLGCNSSSSRVDSLACGRFLYKSVSNRKMFSPKWNLIVSCDETSIALW